MQEKNKDLEISYLFDARCELVFATWTEPAHLQHWFAPEGCEIEFKSIDVRTGGKFHWVIRDKKNGDCWIKGHYLEVSPPKKIVYSMAFTNEAGDDLKAVPSNKSVDWPQELVTNVNFEAIGEKTEVKVHQSVPESEAKKTGAYSSWFSMFDNLQNLLKQSIRENY